MFSKEEEDEFECYLDGQRQRQTEEAEAHFHDPMAGLTHTQCVELSHGLLDLSKLDL
jgi:hypothetical protein